MRHEPKHQNKVGPKPGTPMDCICVALHNSPMTEQQIYAAVGLVYANPTAQRKAMSRSVNAGWLNERAGKYSLSPWLAKIIAARDEDEPEPAPVVITKPPYRPTSSKPLTNYLAGVKDKVRDMSFITCSGVPSKVWGGV